MKRLLPFIALAAVTVLSVFSCQQEPEEIRVSSISLSKSTLELTVGDQASLDATISPDNATNKKISWSSSKESVATVTPDGIVEAVSAGTAFITARSEDSGVNAKCEITVKEKVISVTRIFLNKTSLSLTEEEEFTLEATVTPDNATNKEVTWTSDNEAVATVSAEGVVKAIKAGAANITVTSKDSGVSAKCEITVKDKVISVTRIFLNKTSLSLTEGEEFTLEATVTPDNATNKKISWTSDNEAVATVSAEGVVKALRAGTARITATTVDQGKSASCAVVVAAKMSAVTGEATHISCRNAKLSGKVTLPQTTSPYISFGVLYSTSSAILLGSATQLEAKDYDASFNFSIDTGVLEPETTYYYRSYVILNDEVSYGQIKSFKTLVLSSMIQTLDASDVVPKEATLNAKLDLTDCKYGSIEYGFELTPEGGQAKTLTANNLADKAFSYRDETLSKNTEYSYTSYVKLDGILYKAEPKTFTTTSIQASVTAEASKIQYYSATISGRLTVQSEGSFSKSAVLYYSKTANTLDGLKSNGTRKTLTLGADGSYTAALSSLSPSTSYSYVVVAKVDDVELVTEVKSFKTLTIQASVTAAVSDIKCNSATISVSLNVQSEGSFSKSAVLYYSSSESTLKGLKSNGIRKTLTLGADGSYNANLSSLSSSTSYNYVVVAKVDDVELVTEVKSFKTLTIQASVTAEASKIQCKSATISGSLSVQSEGSFSKSAVLYYSSSERTLDGLKSNGTRKTLTLGADGSYSETISSLYSFSSYNFVVVAKVDDVEFASIIGNFTTLAPPSGSVELGLSVLWASCNLGASKPTEYGGHYQWAGTTDVSDTGIYLDWSNCPYHTGSNETLGWTKYNTESSYGTVDNKTVLEAKDDAAFVALGGKWRMPTDAEWSELRNTSNCSWTWTTIDGVKGCKVQSKKPGYTDNWIFLPAAGSRSLNNHYNIGSRGSYWSSSLNPDYPYNAYYMLFYSSYVGRPNEDRYDGHSIRPVSE